MQVNISNNKIRIDIHYKDNMFPSEIKIEDFYGNYDDLINYVKNKTKEILLNNDMISWIRFFGERTMITANIHEQNHSKNFDFDKNKSKNDYKKSVHFNFSTQSEIFLTDI